MSDEKRRLISNVLARRSRTSRFASRLRAVDQRPAAKTSSKSCGIASSTLENKDAEQQAPRSHVETSLVLEVIALTKAVNDNLHGVIKHTDKLIVRQNVLIGMCLSTIICLIAMVVADYRAQQSQELISRQVALMNFNMIDVANVKAAMGRDLLKIEESMGMLRFTPDAGTGK